MILTGGESGHDDEYSEPALSDLKALTVDNVQADQEGKKKLAKLRLNINFQNRKPTSASKVKCCLLSSSKTVGTLPFGIMYMYPSQLVPNNNSHRSTSCL